MPKCSKAESAWLTSSVEEGVCQVLSGRSELGSVLDGKLQELVDVLGLQFLRQIGAVSFDCARANKELAGNFFIGFVFRYQLKNPAFGRSQGCQSDFFLFK